MTGVFAKLMDAAGAVVEGYRKFWSRIRGDSPPWDFPDEPPQGEICKR